MPWLHHISGPEIATRKKLLLGVLAEIQAFHKVFFDHILGASLFSYILRIPVWSRTHHKVVSMLNPNMHPNSTACLMQPMQVFLRLQRLRINHPGVRAQVHSWKQLHQLCGWRMKQSSLCLGCVSKMQNYCMRSWDDHEMIWCIDADDRTKLLLRKCVMCVIWHQFPLTAPRPWGASRKWRSKLCLTSGLNVKKVWLEVPSCWRVLLCSPRREHHFWMFPS